MEPPALSPLDHALRDIEAHVAEGGWDQQPRLFALALTTDLVRSEPSLAESLGLDANDPTHLTPIEQEEFPPPGIELDEALATVQWPDAVAGAAVVVERLLLPPSAEADVAATAHNDPEALVRAAASHPDRREIRLAAAVLRTGEHFCLLRLRDEPPGADIATGPNLAPGLLEALKLTLN